MREIHVEQVVEAVAALCIDTNVYLEEGLIASLKEAMKKEEEFLAKNILKQLVENSKIARREHIPVCQDTGMAVVFLELGQELVIRGGLLSEAVNEGVRRGYREGFLRKSVVNDPLLRENTGDNAPAVIHTEIVEGDRLKITVAPKGFGSENMSGLKMLKPSQGREGVVDFVVETVRKAGANPCPPLIVGVGIGGTMEKAALLAKRALLRPVADSSPKEHLRELERELMEKINGLGIGPQGLGGKTTALAVKVEAYPTHIAGLPVAVNINCHVARHGEIVL